MRKTIKEIMQDEELAPVFHSAVAMTILLGGGLIIWLTYFILY